MSAAVVGHDRGRILPLGAAWDPRVIPRGLLGALLEQLFEPLVAERRSGGVDGARRERCPIRAPASLAEHRCSAAEVPRCGLGPVCPRLHRSKTLQRIGEPRRESDRAERCGRPREVGLRLGEVARVEFDRA